MYPLEGRGVVSEKKAPTELVAKMVVLERGKSVLRTLGCVAVTVAEQFWT